MAGRDRDGPAHRKAPNAPGIGSAPPAGSQAGLGILQLHLFVIFVLGLVLYKAGGPIYLFALWPVIGAFAIGIVFYRHGLRARPAYALLMLAPVCVILFWLFIRVADAGYFG